MNTDLIVAVEEQPAEKVAQLAREHLTPQEWLLVRFYRELDKGEQAFIRRAIEAMATRDSPN